MSLEPERAALDPLHHVVGHDHVNRAKRIKRDGYGRAGFDLLRLQILLTD
ncbi:hypothetical protein [Streptomyces sp. NPDC101455]